MGVHLLFYLFLAQLVFVVEQDRGVEWIEVGIVDSRGPEKGPGEGEDEKDASPGEEEETPVEEPASDPSADLADPASSASPGPPAETEDSAQVGTGAGVEKGAGGEGVSEYGNRRGPGRGDALKRFGGNARSEEAVRRGLMWLFRHQEPEGHWSGSDFHEHCEGEVCFGSGVQGYDVGHTSLALLCFLGSGITHRKGRYAGSVRAGLDWLLAQQTGAGFFHGGNPKACAMYNHAIACLALAEAYGMTRDPRLKKPLQRGLSFLVSAQQRGGGWDYVPEPTGRGDVSVTGWAVMALKSARIAGLRVRASCWHKARRFIVKMTGSDGRVEYEDKGYGRRGRWHRYGPGMASVGLLCHLYFGEASDAIAVRRIAGFLRDHPPALRALKGEQLHTRYYWYYATLAFFQLGGEWWLWWNESFRDFLVNLQRRDGCAAVSWDPVDGWLAGYGGRLYSTTLSLLSLEVYYRYLPIYEGGELAPLVEEKDASPPDAEQALRRALDAGLASGKRLKALKMLENTGGARARAALEEVLKDPNPVLRWQAARSLGKRGETASVAALLEAMSRESGDDLLPTYLGALGSIGSVEALESLVPYLDHPGRRVRSEALCALQAATGKRFGYDAGKWAEVVRSLAEDR